MSVASERRARKLEKEFILTLVTATLFHPFTAALVRGFETVLASALQSRDGVAVMVLKQPR